MQHPKYTPDIEAEITFLTTEESGRETAVFSGYRPQFYYDGCDWVAIQNYIDVIEPVMPGQTVTTHLSFLTPQTHVGKLYPGKEFLVREGQKVVARGIVTKILNLKESAEQSTAFELKRRGGKGAA